MEGSECRHCDLSSEVTLKMFYDAKNGTLP